MTVSRSCPQCAAVVDFPPEQLATQCAFCETPLVDAETAEAEVDLVAGFDVDRRQAVSLLTHHMQSRYFLPNELKKATRPEVLRGLLVPFFLYDASARSEWTADQGIHWYRTETYTTRVNGKTVTRTRQVQETEWFSTSGSHVATYTDHLVSASGGLPEAEANELEPFDLGKALSFRPELVAGWLAERPTVPHATARATATQELANLENRAIARFLPADRVRNVHNNTSIEVGNLQLVMLPIWIGTYRHQGEVVRLLVNGQTGEVVANLPTSWKKVALAVLATLVLAGILAAVGEVL